MMTETRKILIGKRIAQRREELGLTQDQLALKAGLKAGQKSLTRYETAASPPSLDSLIKLAIVLETSLDWLVGFTDELNNPSNLDDTEVELLMLYRRKSPEIKQKIRDVVRVI